MSSERLFKGPQDIDLLKNAVAEGWIVEPGPLDDIRDVSFYFPFPEPLKDDITGLDVAIGLAEYVEETQENLLFGIEPRKSDVPGQFVRHFIVTANWPLRNDFVLTLDKVGQHIMRHWKYS